MAGNMFLGALLDLGLTRKQLVEDLSGLARHWAAASRSLAATRKSMSLEWRSPGAP